MRTQLHRLAAPLISIAILLAACGGTTNPSGSAIGSSAPGGVVEVRWYCCLGTGQDPEAQLPVENRIVSEFNASHPNIHLTFEVVNYDDARDTLSNELAGQNPPDIVGPVGIGGAEAFHGQWLDLAPLIEQTGFDMSKYEQSAVDFYKAGGEGQVGIPFSEYPSVLFYRASLFEEAGLKEPPHAFGEQYEWPDGTKTDWDYETVRQLGLKLTVDSNNHDATEASFDPSKIVQYGFEPYRDDPRGMGAYFAPGQLADGTTVAIPSEWADAWKWFYDGMWKDHFIMTGPVFHSDDWAGQVDYPFFTGRVAMSNNFLWSTYGVADGGDDWNVAVVPSYKGKTTSPLNADTFRITKASNHPAEAFEVLKYFFSEAEADLLEIYAGMPAKPADQDAFFTKYEEQFTNKVDWQVVKDSLAYADIPNWESYMPAYNESLDLLITYRDRWETEGNLDIAAQVTSLTRELQAIWDR